MNHHRYHYFHFAVLGVLVSVLSPLGIAQTSELTPSDTVKKTMADALAQCHRKTPDGVEVMTFIPPSNEQLATITALGSKAIEPLSRYLDTNSGGGFTQLFAVRFLSALRNPSALAALKKAFGQDQWEVTRMAALDGMFQTSRAAAKTYVEAGLHDKSAIVRHVAESLWRSYDPSKSDN